MAGIPWDKQGQCCLAPSGRFCRYSLGYTRSVLSNAKGEILQVFPGVQGQGQCYSKCQVGDFAVNKVFPGVQVQGQCCLMPSGRFCRYSLM